jgi:hypothetical protein
MVLKPNLPAMYSEICSAFSGYVFMKTDGPVSSENQASKPSLLNFLTSSMIRIVKRALSKKVSGKRFSMIFLSARAYATHDHEAGTEKENGA